MRKISFFSAYDFKLILRNHFGHIEKIIKANFSFLRFDFEIFFIKVKSILTGREII